MRFEELKDIHTHQAGRPDALLSLSPEKAIAGYAMPYSLQLHPWHANEALISEFQKAAEVCKEDENLLAIGECGLDNKCQTPLPLQIEAFMVALQTAKALNLPVIIHCVGYWAEMMRCVKESVSSNHLHTDAPSEEKKWVGPFIIHGFRKGPQLAQQLLNVGFSLSLGAHYNSQTADILPPNRRYWETDEG